MLKASQDTDVVGLVDDGLNPQRPAFLQVLLDAGVLVGEVHLHLGARAKDPGAEGFLVVVRTWRANRIATCSGRPTPTLSATRASKNPRARRGSSKTIVRLTSTWRMDSSHQYPAARSVSVRGVGIWVIQRSKKPWIVAGPRRSQIRCRLAGWSQAAKPLASSATARPALAACRLAHSCPLSHTLAG